jgi:hypothetical protein
MERIHGGKLNYHPRFILYNKMRIFAHNGLGGRGVLDTTLCDQVYL